MLSVSFPSLCGALEMGLNEKQMASKGVPSKNFYVYREPGLSDAEYERIKRNMLDYRNTMDRILEAHYAPPSRTAALQKETTELLRKSREMQEPRSVRGAQTKHTKPLDKNRVDKDTRGKSGKESGRERQSLGRS